MHTSSRFFTVALFAALALFLTVPATQAGSKFENKDTAKQRNTYTWGTDQGEDTATTTFGKDEGTGDSTTILKSRPREPETDWYDKIIITVDPDTKWPKDKTDTQNPGE
ncbi:hypothetical protein [Pseudodesulfovibrio tunisiensis]|uniref:hypothetical protein n=1 Tax=Pseudodesulfovibrio tunisiensis TaxID=463192 RepID=UPI001FB39F34|nr:hypothetical protein [Pseudodesulfovibrio tunisiensis]